MSWGSGTLQIAQFTLSEAEAMVDLWLLVDIFLCKVSDEPCYQKAKQLNVGRYSQIPSNQKKVRFLFANRFVLEILHLKTLNCKMFDLGYEDLNVSEK